MSRITSTEFVRAPGRYQDQAQREPIVIMKHDREHAVILGAEEYHRLKRRDRLALRVGEVSEADITAIRSAVAPVEAAVFDDEVS